MKQALVGLDGIESVDDEWDRDLLHVTYDAARITVERMLETIKQQEFEAEVKAAVSEC